MISIFVLFCFVFFNYDFNFCLLLVVFDSVAIVPLFSRKVSYLFSFLFSMVRGLAFSQTETRATHLIKQFCITFYFVSITTAPGTSADLGRSYSGCDSVQL